MNPLVGHIASRAQLCQRHVKSATVLIVVDENRTNDVTTCGCTSAAKHDMDARVVHIIWRGALRAMIDARRAFALNCFDMGVQVLVSAFDVTLALSCEPEAHAELSAGAVILRVYRDIIPLSVY
jgi:hypothetical protein